jgi:hypothetical protein
MSPPGEKTFQQRDGHYRQYFYIIACYIGYIISVGTATDSVFNRMVIVKNKTTGCHISIKQLSF